MYTKLKIFDSFNQFILIIKSIMLITTLYMQHTIQTSYKLKEQVIYLPVLENYHTRVSICLFFKK